MKTVFFYTLFACFVFAPLACTKTNLIEIPPPDFKSLLLKNSPFKGFRLDETETILSRDTELKVKASSSPTELIFEETYLEIGVPRSVEYKVQFGEVYQNAVELIIPDQIVAGRTYVGLRLKESERQQGFYEAFDKNKNSVTNIFYRISIGGKPYTISFKR